MKPCIALAFALTTTLVAACLAEAPPDTTETAPPETITDQHASGCRPAAGYTVCASADDGNVPTNTVDGNADTRWSCLGMGCWISLDFGSVRPVSRVEIAWYKGDQRRANFKVEASTDGTTFHEVFSGQSSGTTLAAESNAFTETSARVVRIVVNGNTVNEWASITEIVPSATAAPDPTPLWVSTVWANGHARTVTQHGAFDPDDDQVQVAAGEGRKLVIDGAGLARLEGNRSRIYIHADHRDAELVFEANATDSRLENISTKLRSRHNEDGAESNRFGGYGVAFSYADQEADFKIESFHNVHESGRGHPLARHLEYGRWYRFRVQIRSTHGGTHALVIAAIDYDLNGTWTEVGREEYQRTGYRANDVNAKYAWIRANSGDVIQTGLQLRNARFSEIGPAARIADAPLDANAAVDLPASTCDGEED